jgi:outer membrane protein OmpA-like peptidoglycan-associated protein
VSVVFIAGHSDDHGTKRHNDLLTARRAEAVRVQLVRNGIAAKKIKAVGCGSIQPVASNDTEEGRAKNRRVEILLPTPGMQPGCTK